MKDTQLLTKDQIKAVITAFQILLTDLAEQLPDVEKALLKVANQQIMHKNAQKEIIKDNKKKK